MPGRVFLLSILLAGSLTEGRAQHCPFDGSSAIVVQLQNNQGTAVDSTAATIWLVEKTNPLADSCTYATGQLQLSFGKIGPSLVHRYEGAWVSWAEDRLSSCAFNNSSHRVLVLNMAQSRCMVKNGSEFRYLAREFEIRVMRDDKILAILPVNEKDIYPLCTGAGPWDRIQPMLLRLPD